jgi:hypothetical protein
METVGISETSAYFNETTRRRIPEGRQLQTTAVIAVKSVRHVRSLDRNLNGVATLACWPLDAPYSVTANCA